MLFAQGLAQKFKGQDACRYEEMVLELVNGELCANRNRWPLAITLTFLSLT